MCWFRRGTEPVGQFRAEPTMTAWGACLFTDFYIDCETTAAPGCEGDRPELCVSPIIQRFSTGTKF
jgi:hypothetical protein